MNLDIDIPKIFICAGILFILISVVESFEIRECQFIRSKEGRLLSLFFGLFFLGFGTWSSHIVDSLTCVICIIFLIFVALGLTIFLTKWSSIMSKRYDIVIILASIILIYFIVPNAITGYHNIISFTDNGHHNNINNTNITNFNINNNNSNNNINSHKKDSNINNNSEETINASSSSINSKNEPNLNSGYSGNKIYVVGSIITAIGSIIVAYIQRKK